MCRHVIFHCYLHWHKGLLKDPGLDDDSASKAKDTREFLSDPLGVYNSDQDRHTQQAIGSWTGKIVICFQNQSTPKLGEERLVENSKAAKEFCRASSTVSILYVARHWSWSDKRLQEGLNTRSVCAPPRQGFIVDVGSEYF